MTKNPLRADLPILSVLVLSMIATRGVHADVGLSLPETTLAVFALAGWWLASRGAFVVLCVAALAIDVYAVTVGGVDAACFSWAYPFLVPAYAMPWLAGRWVRRAGHAPVVVVRRLAASVPPAALLSYAISSLSFYVIHVAGRGTSPGAYVSTAWPYAAQAVGWTIAYVVVAAAVAAALDAVGFEGATAHRRSR